MMRKPAVLTAAYWRGDGVIEGAMLRSVFIALATASAMMLGLDLTEMMQRSVEAGAGSERTEPVEMQPPRQSDQERPYYPKATPRAPNGAPPQMPGINIRQTPQLLASRMTFTRDGNGDVSAVGRIEAGTAGDFDAFVKAEAGSLKRIFLHSPGGSVGDAIAMGRAIRRAGLGTVVADNAYCASSCPLAFVGGIEREVGRKAWVGVHQIYTAPAQAGTLHDGLADAQRVSAECQDHIVAMGADPRIWIKAMKTSKDRLYVFTPEEFIELKLATKPITS